MKKILPLLFLCHFYFQVAYAQEKKFLFIPFAKEGVEYPLPEQYLEAPQYLDTLFKNTNQILASHEMILDKEQILQNFEKYLFSENIRYQDKWHFINLMLKHETHFPNREAIYTQLANKYPDEIQQVDREHFTDSLGFMDSYHLLDSYILDLNQDKTQDVWIIGNTYFGPSSGVALYFQEKGTFKFAFEGSGFLVGLEKTKQGYIFSHLMSTILPEETQLIQTAVYNPVSKQLLRKEKLYYATQTEIPNQYGFIKQGKVKSDSCSLRTSPRLQESPKIKERQLNEEYFNYSQVIEENIVARYPKKSVCAILYEKGDWYFVVFDPNPRCHTSLSHGMDVNKVYDEKTNTLKNDPHYIQPFIAGWVQKKEIE